MRKKLIIALSCIVLASSIGASYAKPVSNPDLSAAIKLYKAQNYSECYEKLKTIVEKDSPSALAYYYMAITATQLGKKSEAIEYYGKAIALSPENNNISRYASKGKRCLETPEQCEESIYTSFDDEFILNKKHLKSSDSVKKEFEKLKLDNIRREINRNGDINPQKFKEYKDFSSMDVTPTDEEIVAAIRVLQNAGLTNVFNANNTGLFALTGLNNSNQMYNGLGNASLNPQIIQAMLTTNMMQGF